MPRCLGPHYLLADTSTEQNLRSPGSQTRSAQGLLGKVMGRELFLLVQ